MFLFASSSFAEVPVNPHFTPMSLLPQPFASTSSLKVAGIYWLPDYLKGNVSRGSEDKGGGDKKQCIRRKFQIFITHLHNFLLIR